MKKYLAIAALAALVGFVSCTKEPGSSGKISVSPKTLTFSGEAGTMKAAVKTKDASFTATPDADWLSVEVKGKELNLTVTENTTGAERRSTVKIADSHSSCELEVIQRIASPVPGFIPIKSVKAEYGGGMPFVTYVNPEKGGLNYLTFEDFDGNELKIVLYTEMWESKEEVALTEGVYTVGQDNDLTYYAVPGTWFPGGLIESDAITFDSGSCFYANDGTVSYLKTGTIEIKDGIYKLDLKDAEGNEYKYAYKGDVDINITASFGGAGDPTENIINVSCSRVEDDPDTGKTQMCLTLTTETGIRTNIYFYVPTPESGDPVIEGMFSSAEGTVQLGTELDLGVMTMVLGTGVVYPDFTMWAADGFATLFISKNEDGSYMVMANLQDAEAAAATGDEVVGTAYLYMLMSTEIEMGGEADEDEEDEED